MDRRSFSAMPWYPLDEMAGKALPATGRLGAPEFTRDYSPITPMSPPRLIIQELVEAMYGKCNDPSVSHRPHRIERCMPYPFVAILGNLAVRPNTHADQRAFM